MITIDGSAGEGGGQILRTALALSLVTGEAFRMEKIRAGRQKPGILQQHLTAVHAAAQIGSAQVADAELGSQSLLFKPAAVSAGHYHFAVGTAGSTTLVLQTILPALILGNQPSRVVLEGGTHNPTAPPFDFLAKSFLPLLARMGPKVAATLESYGFYPAGGGRLVVAIDPVSKLKPLDLTYRGTIKNQTARALVAKLPRNIAERELKVIADRLGWNGEQLTVEEVTNSLAPGNALFIEIESDSVTEVFTASGKRGVSAETVAASLIPEVCEYLSMDAPIGCHLADQLLLPLALAGEGCFATGQPSGHTLTNINTIKKFLPVHLSVEKNGNLWQVRCTS